MKNSLKGIFVIVGNCIGAGILGMPIICGLTGFIPSTIIMLVILIYMNLTSKLILKANYLFKINNIVLLSGKLLGKQIQILTLILFLLLFTSLITAYIAKGGELIQQIIKYLSQQTIKIEYCHLFLTVSTILLTTIQEKFFYKANQVFMILFISMFLFLVLIFSQQATLSNLSYSNIEKFPYVFPILITTFGFHNIIPLIKNYYNDYNKTKKIINIGMLLTFFIYITWNAIILAIQPINTHEQIINNYNNNKIITEVTLNYINSDLIYIIINIFSFLAIFTSILGQSVGMSFFFIDTLKLNKNNKNKILSKLITFIPPLIITNINPEVFFIALDFAGGLFAVLLFGLLPSLFFIKNKKINISTLTLFKTKILTIITLIILLSFLFLQILKFT